MIHTSKTFDNTISRELNIHKPDKYSSLFKLFEANQDKSFITKGSGLSYSPAFMSPENTIDLSLFNRILSFNKSNGIIICEGGIKLIDILEFTIPLGWYIPITPGYPTISLGGCVAFNIHGKSQFHTGCFKKIVKSLKIFHPHKGETYCSNEVNEELFNLTIGGMGLTGVLLEVEVQLAKMDFTHVQIDKKYTKNIYESLELLESEANNYNNIYSWHDFSLNNQYFGKAIIYAESFVSQKTKSMSQTKKKYISSKRGNFPINLVNSFTSGLINKYYRFNESFLRSKVTTLSPLKAFFPIHGKELYYRLYGNNGFLEYQFIAHKKNIIFIIQEIEQYIKKQNIPIGLASLKLFEGEQCYLNFNDSGICLALDIPNNEKGLIFFNFLDNLCIETKSIMNLSKDSRINSKVVSQTYTEYDDFKNQLLKFDPSRKFNSLLRRRLDL